MRWPVLSYAILPIVVIVVTFAVALIGYSLAVANIESSKSKSINRTTRENMLRINGVFDSYAHVLWGSTGRMHSGSVDEPAWQNFIGVYNLPRNFSGMEAIGLAYSNDVSNIPISYVSPHTAKTAQAVGFDIARIPQLDTVLGQAAASGQTTVSDPLPNIFSTKSDVTSTRTGFLMVAPFYDQTKATTTDDERRQALQGFTLAMFRGDIFFDKVFQNVDLSHVKLEIYLGSPTTRNLLYQGGTVTTNDFRYAQQEITEYGRTFTIKYTFDSLYILSWSLTYFPVIILISSLILGTLFAGVAGYLLRNRYHRLTYEKERDVNFAKDELLSLASHQLRTPATGVKQYLGMVLQGFAGELSDQQRTYLERAYASNNRQLHVINDILHLAKLEAGRIVLTEHEFSIADMVKEIVEEQSEAAKKGELALAYKGPTRGIMKGDSHMLHMVVENLVTNAIKYTPPGGKVVVRLSRLGNYWIVVVKDTGVGIARADYSQLFKQFTRIENDRSNVVTGTGIGLYLAYHLTLLHGGTIGVSSSKGKGTTFTVRLPRKM